MELFLDETPKSFSCELIAHFLKLAPRRVKIVKLSAATLKLNGAKDGITLGELPLLVTNDSKLVRGAAIFEHLVLTSFTESILIPNKDVLKFKDTITKGFEEAQLKDLEETLLNSTFLASSVSLTLADLVVFGHLYNKIIVWETEEKIKYPSLLRWCVHLQAMEGISSFLGGTAITPITVADLPQGKGKKDKKKGDDKKGDDKKKEEKPADKKKEEKPAAKKDEKATEKKDEKPAAKKDEGDDLFGDDDPEAEKAAKALAEKKKAEAAAGKKKVKEAVIAKSVVIFDVKIFDEEQDLDSLAKRIIKIEMDGLMWKTEYKLVPVAYNIKKIQIGCTIEDEKVSTEDLFDKITDAWPEEVQSIDIVTFQKV